jgi:hypothetical protein
MTFVRKQLNEGGAGDMFRRFLDRYGRARTPAEKMIAIDQVIHAFHCYVMSHKRTGETRVKPTRAACVNLIEGKLADVVAFLDGLSAREPGLPEVRETREAWRAMLEENRKPWGDWRIARANVRSSASQRC